MSTKPWADPETGASGYGVICPTCRRMPNTDGPRWATIVFPDEYTNRSWNATLEKPRPLGCTIEVPRLPLPANEC